MANFYLRQGDLLPILVATLTNDVGTVVDLSTATAVQFKMRRLDEDALTVDAAGSIVNPGTDGKVSYTWQPADVVAWGEYHADWLVTFPTGTQSFPNPDLITIDIGPSLANIPSISAADLAVIRGRIGAAVPPTNIDLAMALERLGTVDAVALEVLEGRYAAMVSGPAKWAMEGDASFDYTETIKALRSRIAGLQATAAAADGTGGPITVSPIIRTGGWSR